jgi:hypothetical protein
MGLMSRYVDDLRGEVSSADRRDHKTGPFLSVHRSRSEPALRRG